MQNTINTGEFRAWLEKDGTKNLNLALKQMTAEAIWAKFVKKTTTDQFKKRVTNWENASNASRMTESSLHPIINMTQGHSQTWTQQRFGAKVVFSDLMQHFKQYEFAGEMTRQLKMSLSSLMEVVFHAYLEYGELAASSVPKLGALPIIRNLGADGNELFDAAHTWVSGGSTNTWSNISSAYVTLDDDGIQTHYQQIRRWVDNVGRPLNLKMTNIMYPPELRSRWIKTAFSEKVPDVNTNAINPVKKLIGSVEGIESQWLGSTTDYYIMTDADENGCIQMLSGWENRIKRGELNPDSGDLFISIDSAFAHGCLYLMQFLKVT